MLIVAGDRILSRSTGRTGVVLIGVFAALATLIQIASLRIHEPEFDSQALMIPWLGSVLCELIVVVGGVLAIVDLFSSDSGSRALGVVSIAVLGVAALSQGVGLVTGPALVALGVAIVVAPGGRRPSTGGLDAHSTSVVPDSAGNLAD